jgi:hypothetical protein
MIISINIVCKCGCEDEEDFMELDPLDYSNGNSYMEFLCLKCSSRICIEKIKIK